MKHIRKVFYQKNFILAILIVCVLFLISFFARASVIVVNDPTGDDIDNGLCSIVEAMQNASFDNTSGSADCVAGSGNDVISIQTNITIDTIYDADGDGVPYGVPGNSATNLTINGNGFTIERDPGAPTMRLFFFSGFSNIEINNLTISGGDTVTVFGKGGAIYATSLNSLTLNNVTFDNNRSIDGGALYVSIDSSPNLTLTMDQVVFSDNISNGKGGAVYLKNSSNIFNAIATNITVDTNTSTDDAGAFYLENISSFNASDSYFTANKSRGLNGKGGVFYLAGASSVDISNSYFYGNRPNTVLGGVFYVTGGSSVDVSGSTFENNVARDGGVFYLFNGADLTVFNSSFKESSAISSGGIIYSHQTDTPNQINFYHNNTNGSFSGADGSPTMFNCIFVSSGGGEGGGAETSSCLGNTGTSFEGDLYFFENNILFGGGCDGNIQNASFINNLGGNSGAKCSNTGLDNTIPTNFSGTLALKGGLWKTLSLDSGSNAIDTGVAGTLGCPATDGRGFPRPYNGNCDIGAYEYTGENSVTITETGGGTQVSESGITDTYSISLGGGPSSSVTVNLNKDASDFNVSPSSVTFTTLNWFVPKTITVSAVDNTINDGTRTRAIDHSVTSSDSGYLAIIPNSVSVSILDNDSAPTSSGNSNSSSGSLINGCTDSSAINYNPNARRDNGSCVYPSQPPTSAFGCLDIGATNYNPSANISDNSCVYPLSILQGCDDIEARNYDIRVIENDGSCRYEHDLPAQPTTPTSPPSPVFGCTDSSATNYNSSADTNDGLCQYPAPEIIFTETETQIPTSSYQTSGSTIDYYGENTADSSGVEKLEPEVSESSFVGIEKKENILGFSTEDIKSYFLNLWECFYVRLALYMLLLILLFYLIVKILRSEKEKEEYYY